MILKRILIFVFILSTVLIPLSSCKEETKKPAKKPAKEEQTETLEETINLDDLSIGDRVRATVEVDPMYYDQDPSEDDELNILLIGNSFSTHWPDELAELLGAAGYENAMVCDIYHSGAVFEEHWTWYLNNENAETFHINRPGQSARKSWADVGLEECVSYANWDIISFQQGNRLVGATERYRLSISQWLPQLFGYVYAYFPEATYYWQQDWSHTYSTREKTDRITEWHRVESERASQEWGFINAPLGDAWPAVRYDPLFYDFPGEDFKNSEPNRTLHTRLYEDSSLKGTITNADLGHDGNIGGGQYLNACVWFEMITHESVVGNPFVPKYYQESTGTTYTFTAEQISKLQNAAHQAVFEDYGDEWYK